MMPLKPVTVMPFGKHRDQPLTALPADYVTFLLEKFEGLRPALRAALTAEVARRAAVPAATPSPPPRPPAPAAKAPIPEERIRSLVRQEVFAIFKRLAAEGGAA